ncbi:MAG: pyridoxal phosphate-dependent aminotransferase [Prevotella buccae]|uniref:MalY/PatB family protein n=1 Tax=Segatella buccae TaxID=28126 RepID=UPI00242B7EF8|nr:MalY/PatB family protein [Segatella buccae]MBS5895843.1 pyridoxal phosphate-dependent aminotransferase [Segatella buccae]
MSTFDFDTVINRRGTNSYKWDIVKEEDVIPLWVADMDFKAAPAILEALKKRVEHGVFGYTLVPDSYYEAIINWFARRHNWQIDRSWIIYTTGVVPAVSCAIKALTLPGEKVLIQTPDYNCFFSSIKNNGCEVAENELVRRGDSYEVDFEDFERQCADEKTTVFLLCNPHNPAGRVWTKEELERMNDICLTHGVRVISDEIHCELVMPSHRFTPFAAISDACRDNSVVLNSPTKAFNIAGLQIANIICADPAMRRRIDRAVNINEVCDVNPFGVVALQAAYNESEEWLDSLNHYIWGNYLALKEFIAKELPRLEVTRLEGTYLAWVDIKATGLTSDEAYGKLMKEGRVYVNSGTMYGRRAGEGYLRINLACPRATLLEGMKRMGGVLRQYLS